MRRCVLHIGAEKTGTKAVQAALLQQRHELREQGVLYSDSLRPPQGGSHARLHMYAMDKGRVDDWRRGARLTTPSRVEAFRGAVRRALAEELAGSGPADMFLLSSEHCQSRLRTVEEIERLADLLGLVCDEVEVILYLRPQHETAVSLYSTRIKVGHAHADPFADGSAEPGYYDYGALVSRWAAVFGKSNLKVRLYQRHELAGGDILEDFASVVGLSIPLRPSVTRANPSLSPRGLRVLGAVNTVLPRFVLGRRNPLRRPLNRIFETFYPGSGPTVDADEAAAFLARFESSNEVVRSMYFRDRGALFESLPQRTTPTNPAGY